MNTIENLLCTKKIGLTQHGKDICLLLPSRELNSINKIPTV